MPKLIRLYIRQCAIGFAIAALFVGMLLWFDIANLWHLVSSSEMGLVAGLVMWVNFGVIFAGVQFAIAIMGMAEKDEGGSGGRRAPALKPVPAESLARVPRGAARLLRPFRQR